MKKLSLYFAMAFVLPGWAHAQTDANKLDSGAADKAALGSLEPRGKRRVIYNSDPSNTMSQLSDPAAQPKELREIVRNYAREGQIDTLVQEVFSEAMTVFWRTDKCPYDVRYWHQRLVPMMNAGLMPVEVLMDECHKQEMEFIAGFRMNDRHGQNPDFFEQLAKEHPDWILTDYRPSWGGAPARSHQYGCSLDYSVPGVREFLFSIMEEVATRFDVDGIEFNFTRLAECFPIATAETSQPIMTEFVRRVQGMLEEVGTKKNRQLSLGVRVPQQLEGCRKIGLDVATWIQEGLISYVAPGDFGFTDFNEQYENFVGLARQYDCYVYPQIQTRIGVDVEIDMVPARYRAAVKNFYGAGADGFSTQNFFFHWGPNFAVPGEDGPRVPHMYPQALQYLQELRSPDAIVAAGDRHYLFFPLWGGGSGPSGIYQREEIVLERDKIGERGEFRFRLCEQFPADPLLPLTDDSSGLTFIPDGYTKGDEIAIDVNGQMLPSEHVRWTWYTEPGRPPSCKLALSGPPFVYGDNYLGLSVTKHAQDAGGKIRVNRLECLVRE